MAPRERARARTHAAGYLCVREKRKRADAREKERGNKRGRKGARGWSAMEEGRKSEASETEENESERERDTRGRISLLFVRHVRAWPPHAYPLRAPVASYFID